MSIIQHKAVGTYGNVAANPGLNMLRSMSECFLSSSTMHFRWWDGQNSELVNTTFRSALGHLSRAEAFISHQGRPPGSRQLSNKLKQRRKIRIVGAELQKLTAHSTGYMAQIPARKGSSLEGLYGLKNTWMLLLYSQLSSLKTTTWTSNPPTSLSYWWCFQIHGSFWTKVEPVKTNKQTNKLTN